MQWINAIIQGILLGGLYALLAAGLSLMFGVMRIVNLAHGALAILAAYLGLVIVQATGISPFLALLAVVPIMAAVGYLLQWGVFNRALSMGGLSPLLAAFGLAVVVTQLLQLRFSADLQSLQVGSLSVASITITDQISIGVLPLITFVVGVVVILGLQIFLSRAPLGRAMRAASDDPQTVPLMGIDNRRVYALATAIALATVGIAGMFLGMRGNFNPTYGDAMLIFAFEAVIIGGLGSLWGTLAGGMVLGIAQTVGAQVNPSYGILIGNLVFLAILAFRPTGLMPKAVTT
ncbi:MAG: branched-chain amino acid ABC transporter permease [Candidatus Nanopelagicales bacterium]|jgi:branched-chain amino acid transport system permease protein